MAWNIVYKITMYLELAESRSHVFSPHTKKLVTMQGDG